MNLVTGTNGRDALLLFQGQRVEECRLCDFSSPHHKARAGHAFEHLGLKRFFCSQCSSAFKCRTAAVEHAKKVVVHRLYVHTRLFLQLVSPLPPPRINPSKESTSDCCSIRHTVNENCIDYKVRSFLPEYEAVLSQNMRQCRISLKQYEEFPSLTLSGWKCRLRLTY